MEDGDAVNVSAVDVMAVNAVAARYQKSAGLWLSLPRE